MVREEKFSFDERSHPELFDEFPGFYATWEEEDGVSDELDPSVERCDQNPASGFDDAPGITAENEMNPKPLSHQSRSTGKHLAGADWMNDPSGSR